MFLGYFVNTQAQEYEIRTYGGANYYQGDLVPSTSRFSFSEGKLAWGIMIGAKANDFLKINLKYMNGQLAASDANAKQVGRRERNLSFVSPLYELGINSEMNINRFLPVLNKYGISVYTTVGINVFHFRPKTFKRNVFGDLEIVDLQPLGTEGQGLPGYGEFYSLVGVNIPVGFGFRFHLGGNIEMGLEIVPRITFTDYLDDVSGAYVQRDVLLSAGKDLTAELANRTGEYFGSEPIDTPAGALRGNPENNDWYFFSALYLSYNFGAGYTKPQFKYKKAQDLLEGQGEQ